jgi:hypothetical protein
MSPVMVATQRTGENDPPLLLHRLLYILVNRWVFDLGGQMIINDHREYGEYIYLISEYNTLARIEGRLSDYERKRKRQVLNKINRIRAAYDYQRQLRILYRRQKW